MTTQEAINAYFDDRQRRDAARIAAGAVLSPAPDVMAEGLQLGRELDVPPTVAAGSPEVFRTQAAQKRATTALSEAPRTSAWLRDTVNGALASDDLENLTAWERELGAFGRATGRGFRRLSAAPAYGEATINADLASDFGLSFEEIYAQELARFPGSESNPQIQADARRRARFRFDLVQQADNQDRFIAQGAEALARAGAIVEKAQSIPMSATAAQFRDGALAQAENSLEGAFGAFVRDPVGGAFFLGETAAEFLPVLAASTAGTAATRSPAVGVTIMGGGSFLQENATEAIRFLNEQGIDLSTPEAAQAVLADQTILTEARRRGVTRGVIIAAFDVISGGVAGQALVRNTGGELVAQGLAQAFLGAGGEATAQAALGDELDYRDIVVEGLAETVTAPIEAAGVAGRGITRQLGSAARSGETAARLQEVDDLAAGSRLKARAPDKFREALDAQGLADTPLYVPADALNEYFQTKGEPPGPETLEEWGLTPDEFAERVAAGQDISVPLSSYAAHIAGTEDAAWFAENGTFDPNEFSSAEARAFNDAVRDVLEQELEVREAEAAADRALRSSEVQIAEDMVAQLRAAGRSPDVARNEARLWSSFWATMGQRYGVDPLDLARSMRVEVRGPEQIQRQRDTLDIALNTLRRQGADALKPRGPSLLDFVADQGGIRDAGGDLAAMDAPSRVIAQTAQEARDANQQTRFPGMADERPGLGMDEMSRAAIEAGFFPEAKDTDVDEAALLLAAITDELAGRARYREGDGPDPDLARLASDLSRLGVDLSGISNDEAIAALNEGRTLRQSARGSAQIPKSGVKSGTTVISIFEGADLSTVLHESAHFFLEAFTALAIADDAPHPMRDDLKAIRQFLGAESVEFTTEQHEKWARAFEAWLMEGKAPSPALSDAFARFKTWLLRLYRSVQALNVRLTPEVREVMSRMVATDREIAEARELQSISPLFQEAPPGMTQAEFESYRRVARRSADKADKRLLDKAMAAVRREKTEWWRKERAAVEKEVAREINAQPVYRLTEALGFQRWLGNRDAEIPDLRLDKATLVEQFGDGVLDELSRSRLGGKRAIYASGGANPSEVAEFFGFSDAVQMVRSLQNAGKRIDAIRDETDRRMVQRHGDVLYDGTIEAEAMAAIQSEQVMSTSLAEARHLAKRAGRETRMLTNRFFRQRARRMVGQMSVRDLLRPEQYLRAERRAARRAQDAFARVAKGAGGEAALADALQAKEQQILAALIYDEAKAAADEVLAGRDRMMKYSKASVRRKLEGGYIEQIDSLLEGYDFRQRTGADVRRSERLSDFVDRMIAEGREGELAIDERLLNEASRKHYTRMTLDQVRGLFDTVQNLDYLGRFKQRLIDAQQKRDLEATVTEIIDTMDANLEDRPPSRVETSGERIRKAGRDYLNLTLNAETHLREADGRADHGPAWTAMKAGIDAGMARLTERRHEAAKALDAIYGAYSAKEKREMGRKVENKALGGMYSKWDVISVALNTGNEQNYRRLINSRVDGSFTGDQVQKALDQLDERDWKTVQAIWDYVDSFWTDIADKEKRNTGVYPRKVEAALQVDAPTGVRGGYYPIRYDQRLATRVTEFETKDLFDRMRAGKFGKAQTRDGHTKERKRNVLLPLRLDLGVLHEHVNAVLYDIEIGEAVSNAHKVLRAEPIRDAFRRKGKRSDYEALELWLQDVAAGDQVRGTFGQTALRHLRSGFVLSRLAFNLSTALIQPTGLLQSAVVVGKKDMARGTLAYLGRMRGWVNDLAAVSPFMRERQRTFERDVFNLVGDLESGPVSGLKRFQRDVVLPLSFFMMQRVQYYVVDMPTWVAAYEKEIAVSGDEAKARTYADNVVRRAQGSGLMSDRGMMERGTMGRDIRQSEIPRLFTALGSYMFAKGNIAYEKTMGTNFRSPAEAMTWAVDMALLFAFEALLYNVVKGFIPDEDEPPEAWLTWIASETALSMMSTLPFARDVASGLQGFGGGGIYGSIVDTAITRPLTQISQGEVDRALVKSLVDAGGVFLHLPSSQAKTIINGLVEEDMTPKTEPDPLVMLGLGGEGRRSMADLVFGGR